MQLDIRAGRREFIFNNSLISVELYEFYVCVKVIVMMHNRGTQIWAGTILLSMQLKMHACTDAQVIKKYIYIIGNHTNYDSYDIFVSCMM